MYLQTSADDPAAHLVFNQSKTAHVTPLLKTLLWLPAAARIKFKTLTLTYKAATKETPSYLNSFIQVYVSSAHYALTMKGW